MKQRSPSIPACLVRGFPVLSYVFYAYLFSMCITVSCLQQDIAWGLSLCVQQPKSVQAWAPNVA